MNLLSQDVSEVYQKSISFCIPRAQARYVFGKVHFAFQAGTYFDKFQVFLSLPKQVPKECLQIDCHCARYAVFLAVILRIQVFLIQGAVSWWVVPDI